MFIKLRFSILILFAAVCFLSGTHIEEPKISHSVYYENQDIFDKVSQLPVSDESKELIHDFYKNNHNLNVKLDAIADIKNIP